mgnify:CR=1 FL=1
MVKLFSSINSGIKCIKTSPKSAPAAKLTRYIKILLSLSLFIERKNIPTKDIRLTIATLTIVYKSASFIFHSIKKKYLNLIDCHYQ